MADKYSIIIQPNMSPEDAKKLEDDLNKRFNNVAKKAGKNLGNSLGGAVKVGLLAAAGAIAALIASNPFDKINEDLNKILDTFDNIQTFAGEFGVSSGKYAIAKSIAGSVGIDNFETILNRFADKLEGARQKDEKGQIKDPYLKEFLGAPDVIDAFYSFADTLKKMEPDRRNAALNEVFGGRMGTRLSEFVQTDLKERYDAIFKAFPNLKEQELTKFLNEKGDLEDYQKILREQNKFRELMLMGKATTKGTIEAQAAVNRAEITKGVQQLSEYQSYAELKLVQERVATTLDGIRSDLTTTLLPILQTMADYLKQIVDWIRNKVDAIKQKGWRGVFD